jgi:hypothetical protein
MNNRKSQKAANNTNEDTNFHKKNNHSSNGKGIKSNSYAFLIKYNIPRYERQMKNPGAISEVWTIVSNPKI